ncbi:hypothetical protein [Pseudarthrobacter sulfonivorans]|uniref:hypothetical protein n=1 Tax=Pseudarthrobacter sulfonivorans TaxID=121292 RepID=UPI002860B0DE|nr:hypothetical protein [Pseudarthrobacter sulfonivorans]MDR6417235.1 hypothetical protein [Pseudarthrobacter sulfonivorans]
MTRPDSGSPDQSANQDDAVWLDLVARLEGKSPDGSSTEDGDPAPAAPDSPDSSGNPAKDGAGPDTTGPDATTDAPADTPGRSATFRDFDPLGLAGRAPMELSAADRLAAAPGPPGGGPSRSGDDAGAGHYPRDGGSAGPRDYDVQDDGGDFVPEEPPSLSGTDPLTMLAWLGAVGAPLALLLSVMFWRSAPLLAILGMVTAFILAVVYLIMKLPQEKDENDDGARV